MNLWYITIIILSAISALFGFTGYLQLRKICPIAGILLAAGISCLLTIIRLSVGTAFGKYKKIQIAILITTAVSLTISMVLFTLAAFRLAAEKDTNGVPLRKTFKFAHAASIISMLCTFTAAVIVSVLFFVEHVQQKQPKKIVAPKVAARPDPVKQQVPGEFDARKMLESFRTQSN